MPVDRATALLTAARAARQESAPFGAAPGDADGRSSGAHRDHVDDPPWRGSRYPRGSDDGGDEVADGAEGEWPEPSGAARGRASFPGRRETETGEDVGHGGGESSGRVGDGADRRRRLDRPGDGIPADLWGPDTEALPAVVTPARAPSTPMSRRERREAEERVRRRPADRGRIPGRSRAMRSQSWEEPPESWAPGSMAAEPRPSATGESSTTRERSTLPSEALVRGRDGVWELPVTLAGARVSPPWLAVGGAALVVVAAVAVVVLAFVRGEPASEPVPTRVRPAASATAARSATRESGAGGDRGGATMTAPPSAGGSPGAVGAAATPAGEYLVHVVGKVRRAGVVAVPAGARLSDAIAKAGGAAPGAVLTGVNLARPVVDGEQIVVPDKNGAPIPVNTMPPPATPRPGAAPAPPAQLIDLNTADQAALESLPGVGPALAGRILAWRTEHGRFTSVDELGEVSGIGEKRLEEIRPKVRV